MIQAGRRRVCRICDRRPCRSGHASLARLPRLPLSSFTLWLGPSGGRQIAQVSSAKDLGMRVLLSARRMWETRNERVASISQVNAMRALVRGQARPRYAAASSRGSDGGRHSERASTAAARLPLGRGWDEGAGASSGSAGANPSAGGDEANGGGPDEGAGEGRSGGTVPGRVTTASSLLRSKSKIAERWELKEIARNRWCPEPESNRHGVAPGGF